MAELDRGAGNERTALAWQRTALAIVAGSAILSRLTFDQLGRAALVSVAIGAPTGVWVLLESRTRYRRDAAGHRRTLPRGGRAALTLTVATLALGLIELLALIAD